jgi:putative FmdB family regulatory protein
MPIYEFTCEDCSKDSEQLVRSSDWKNHAQCPHCGSVKLEKKLSVFSAGGSGADAVDLPPCSGMPSNCGRCSLDN